MVSFNIEDLQNGTDTCPSQCDASLPGGKSLGWPMEGGYVTGTVEFVTQGLISSGLRSSSSGCQVMPVLPRSPTAR